MCIRDSINAEYGGVRTSTMQSHPLRKLRAVQTEEELLEEQRAFLANPNPARAATVVRVNAPAVLRDGEWLRARGVLGESYDPVSDKQQYKLELDDGSRRWYDTDEIRNLEELLTKCSEAPETMVAPSVDADLMGLAPEAAGGEGRDVVSLELTPPPGGEGDGRRKKTSRFKASRAAKQNDGEAVTTVKYSQQGPRMVDADQLLDPPEPPAPRAPVGSVTMCDIIEHEFDGVGPRGPSRPRVGAGFPRVVHRSEATIEQVGYEHRGESMPVKVKKSRWRIRREQEPTEPRVSDEGVLSGPLGESDQQNRAALAAMHPDEILEAQRALAASLPPKLLERWKGKQAVWSPADGAAPARPQRPPQKSGEPDGGHRVAESDPSEEEEIPISELEAALHENKTEWTTPVQPQQPDEPSHVRPFLGEASREDLRLPTARFGLRGDRIASESDVKGDERSYLYHHGDEPDKAGYTLQEMFMLAQSATPAQRTLSLSLLTHTIRTQSVLGVVRVRVRVRVGLWLGCGLTSEQTWLT
eukprot:TRINITY_DN8185_c0_g1_i1.p1 TRINITY_DN8185_c0_g1~~TRINITY_DN8185_c0_g1_i1.p1  ORF type:complete len:528 (-),score=96.70 TRINITY_DN8185_c0_g1_i1:272-1855(-)